MVVLGKVETAIRATAVTAGTTAATALIGVHPASAAGLLPDLECHGHRVTIMGTSGPDRLVGTPGRDVFIARGGDDVIRGGGGDDVVCAGKGRDSVRTRAGRDLVDGGPGYDRAVTWGGIDRCRRVEDAWGCEDVSL